VLVAGKRNKTLVCEFYEEKKAPHSPVAFSLGTPWNTRYSFYEALVPRPRRMYRVFLFGRYRSRLVRPNRCGPRLIRRSIMVEIGALSGQQPQSVPRLDTDVESSFKRGESVTVKDVKRCCT
jgi:hypothetical protein